MIGTLNNASWNWMNQQLFKTKFSLLGTAPVNGLEHTNHYHHSTFLLMLGFDWYISIVSDSFSICYQYAPLSSCFRCIQGFPLSLLGLEDLAPTIICMEMKSSKGSMCHNKIPL